jgi:hypothetical protein
VGRERLFIVSSRVFYQLVLVKTNEIISIPRRIQWNLNKISQEFYEAVRAGFAAHDLLRRQDRARARHGLMSGKTPGPINLKVIDRLDDGARRLHRASAGGVSRECRAAPGAALAGRVACASGVMETGLRRDYRNLY